MHKKLYNFKFTESEVNSLKPKLKTETKISFLFLLSTNYSFNNLILVFYSHKHINFILMLGSVSHENS